VGSTPRLTEERLRTWLDSNQVQRERLCLAILSLDPSYTDVRPRRPKGGPDGSRDIEATVREGLPVWGAVGFRNQASDSPEDKRTIRAKFVSDLDAALTENPDLKGFIFFTNVDLTPSEVDELKGCAREKGLHHVDIYYRERLRMVLDSPEGLAFRYQYLEIPMSPEEQASFFARFGRDIERLISKRFGQIDEKLARVEFLQECQKPLRRVAVILGFATPLTPTDLGAYRILAVIQDLSRRDPHPALCFGGRDACPVFTFEGRNELRHGHLHLAWTVAPSATLQESIISFSEPTLCQLILDCRVVDNRVFPTLGSLDEHHLTLYGTSALVDKLAGIAIIANDYIVASEEGSALATMGGGPLVAVPASLLETSADQEWVGLVLKGPQYPEFEKYGSAMPSPPFAVYRRWDLTFSAFTPQRLPPNTPFST
jgi:hypothetical protein